MKHIIIVFFVIFMLFYIDNLNKMKKLQKKIDKIEKFSVNLDDTQDKQAINNFLSLAKGGNVTLSSLNITGDLKINGSTNMTGNTNITGDLKVNGNTNMTGMLNVANNNFIFKDNRLQYPAGKYELNFGNDGWVRLLNINTGSGTDYSVAGFAATMYHVQSNIINSGTGELYVNNKKLVYTGANDVTIGHFIIKDNRIQYPGGGYELNFNSTDKWIRALKINTTKMGEYNGNLAGFALFSASGGGMK